MALARASFIKAVSRLCAVGGLAALLYSAGQDLAKPSPIVTSLEEMSQQLDEPRYYRLGGTLLATWLVLGIAADKIRRRTYVRARLS